MSGYEIQPMHIEGFKCANILPLRHNLKKDKKLISSFSDLSTKAKKKNCSRKFATLGRECLPMRNRFSISFNLSFDTLVSIYLIERRSKLPDEPRIHSWPEGGVARQRLYPFWPSLSFSQS